MTTTVPAPRIGTRLEGPRQAPWQGPIPAFMRVCPSAHLRDLLIARYRALGWRYFVTFQDVNGFGLSAALGTGPDYNQP